MSDAQVDRIVTQLQDIKTDHPNLENSEVLKILELKILSEIRNKIVHG